MTTGNNYKPSLCGHGFAEVLTLLDLDIARIAEDTEVPEDVLINWAKGSCIPARYVAKAVYAYIWGLAHTRDLLFLEKCAEVTSWQKQHEGDIFAPLKAKAEGSLVKFASLLVESDDEKIKMTQAYAIASKRINPDGRHWYRMREILGDKCKKTLSDAGGIKIGSRDFSMIIPNGYGDGITRYAILPYNTFNDGMFDFETSVKGSSIRIYDYDCGSRVLETLSGKYNVYTREGIVVFADMQPKA